MKSKLNSAVDSKTIAAWLPAVIQAMKGESFPVKSDSKSVYVSTGNDSQYAITPKSETTGTYEFQTKEGGKVVVKNSGEYKNIEELVKQVTTKTKENSSKNTQSKTVLVAGKNLRRALGSLSLDSNRDMKDDPSLMNYSLQDLERSNRRSSKSTVPMNSSKLNKVNLRASFSEEKSLKEKIGEVAGDTQPVSAVLFNLKCPVSGRACLAIAFFDSLENCYVRAILDTDGEGVKTYATLDEFLADLSPVEAVYDEVPFHEEAFYE